MKQLVALAAIVLGLGVYAMAAPTTVTGVLVDKACYAHEKGNTAEEKSKETKCAQDCARQGNQVALVTSAGEVYDVTGALAADKNAKLVPHMLHTVTLTGEVTGAKEQLAIAATELKMVSK